ncbi:MAG: HepT-like ribonuclease domain-containing protein [Armatimonadota bacterium]
MLRDEGYLLDIRYAAQAALRFIDGKSFEDFTADEQLQFAVIRALELIGEAARRFSDEYRTMHPSVPWSMMISMRNRILHEYDRVDLRIVWDTIQQDLPVLLRLIEPLIPPPS